MPLRRMAGKGPAHSATPRLIAPVILIGDSITMHWNDTATPTPGLPSNAQAFGIGGQRVMAFNHLPFPADAGSVLLMMGTNDVSNGSSAADIAAAYPAAINHLLGHAPHAIPWLLTVLPSASYDTNAAARNATIQQLNPLIKALGYRYIDTWAALQVNGELPDLDSIGGTHLSVSGYTKLKESIWP